MGEHAKKRGEWFTNRPIQFAQETCPQQIHADDLTKALCALLDETFENVHGYSLDKAAFLFETPATISAVEASIPVEDKWATLAAQVKQVTFDLIWSNAMHVPARFVG